jgi:aubergine-like protein
VVPPIAPGASAPPPQKPVVPQPTLPAPVAAPVPTPRPASPARHAEQAGRGRGVTPAPVTTPATSKTSSSEDSPPAQHSPTSSSTSGGGSIAPAGRAALRGLPHQPCALVRTELLPPLERMQLQEGGDVGKVVVEEKREVRIESVLYTRPGPILIADKCGTSGVPVKILCNYFEVLEKPDWVLHQYHVDFNPPIDLKSLRIRLMKNHDHLFPKNKAFDGSTLYTLTRLPDVITELASTRESDNTIITIKIKRVGEIVPTSPQFVHLFNLVFRRCLKLYGMQEIDRSYFDMTNKIQIPKYNLELINGLSTSIALYEQKLLLCAELTHKLLHKKTIHDMMSDIYRRCRSDAEFKEQVTSEIVGRIVMTTYNNKTYKIDDINWDQNPTNTFNTKRGDVTFIEYYKSHYEHTVVDKMQPLLLSLPSGKDKRRAEQQNQVATPALLIPEFCVVTGVDEKMRMDFNFKRELEKFSKIGPAERCDRLTKFVNNFKSNEKVNVELKKWEMDFSNQPSALMGRTLQPESLMFGRGVTKLLDHRADWGNDLKKVQMLSSINLRDWIVVFPMSKKAAASQFVRYYSEVIGSMGINAERPKEVQMNSDNADQYVNTLKQEITDKTQMVVCIVSSKSKVRYDAIKRICCLERPVPSQVCTSQIVEDLKKGRSVVTKIAIQMNCKLGGEIWQSHIPLKKLMICGVDTYHDSAKKHGSVCAFIATSNPTYTKYFSRATLQETHQELSSNLSITVKSACEYYNKMNKELPDRIIIYRDGISDGQLSQVIEHEIPQIEKAFSMISSNYKPMLTVIIVKKRGNTRFFAQDARQGLVNPPCGTVIDTVVTRREWADFYLISQCCTQGTVNPTHYNIIHCTNNLKADHFQKLSFKLTHMYYNWPGTIRVPSVCQYAHKLAFLVGQSLHKEHHTSLCDKLFYL